MKLPKQKWIVITKLSNDLQYCLEYGKTRGGRERDLLSVVMINGSLFYYNDMIENNEVVAV